ncbi:MAG: hypothetical protein H6706_14430 [Myxococcales bacterium]|nr:hypothetical protein [Myxococcales bacterium]
MKTHLSLIGMFTAGVLAGCGVSGPRVALAPSAVERRVADEAQARGLPVRLRRKARGTAISLAVPVDVGLAWSLDGATVAMASTEALVLVPAEAGPAVEVAIEPPAKAVPTVHWLADGGLWLDAGGGRLLVWTPGAPGLVPADIDGGKLAAVRPDGQRVLVWRGLVLVGFTPTEHGWRGRSLGEWPQPGPVVFAGDALYVAGAGRLSIRDAETFDPRPGLPWPHAPGARREPRQPAQVVAVHGDHATVLAEPWRYTWKLPDGLGLVEQLPAMAGPVLQAALTREGVWRVDADSGLASDEAGPDPAVRAVAADAAGERVALLRGDGLWVRIDGRMTRRAEVSRRPVEAVAIPGRAGETWVLGLDASSDPRVPTLAAGVVAPQRVRPAAVSAIIRAGVDVDTGDPGAEVIGRVSLPALHLGGREDGPFRQHLLIPALQLSTEVQEADERRFALHLSAALAWRTQRAARLGEAVYVDGTPWTVTLEPGVRLLGGTAVELSASVMTETLGGVFGRVGYDLEIEERYAVAGLELGQGPVYVVAGVGLMFALIYGLSKLEKPNFCFRCNGPNGESTP